MKTLVVDDEHLVRWFFQRSLLKLGYSVVTAACVSEAQSHLNESIFDAVVLDLRMPGGGGMDLVNELIDNHYDPQQVIVCSAYINDDIREQLKNMGVDILPKPFNLLDFQNLIQEREQNICKNVA